MIDRKASKSHMRAQDPGTDLQGIIREFIQLDCQALPLKIYGPGVSARSMPRRVASVSTIRSLLVTFGLLEKHLKAIIDTDDLDQYYARRRALAERVVPEAIFAFEFCRQTLSMKGATDLPIATKLAKSAMNVYDHVDIIKHGITLSLEYHELKYKILGDIREFAQRDNLSSAELDPLNYSINVSLPRCMEAFAESASKNFPTSVAKLQVAASSLADQVEKRINKLKDLESAPSISHGEPHKEERHPSPLRPKINLLRGVKCRQPLTNTRQRIPSIRALELEKPKLDASENETESENQIKVSPSKYFSELAQKSVACTNGSRGSSILSDTGMSRLKQPSRIENRRLVEPRRQVSNSAARENSKSKLLNSKISRPTLVEHRPSVSNLQSTPRIIGRQVRRSVSSTPLQENSNCSVKTPRESSRLSLSPENSLMEETPLSRRSSSQFRDLSRHHHTHHSSALPGTLSIPRTRRVLSQSAI